VGLDSVEAVVEENAESFEEDEEDPFECPDSTAAKDEVEVDSEAGEEGHARTLE